MVALGGGRGGCSTTVPLTATNCGDGSARECRYRGLIYRNANDADAQRVLGCNVSLQKFELLASPKTDRVSSVATVPADEASRILGSYEPDASNRELSPLLHRR